MKRTGIPHTVARGARRSSTALALALGLAAGSAAAATPRFLSIINPYGLSDVGFSAAIRLVDLDADGDLDALAGNADGNLVFMQNTGTVSQPSFAAPITNPFGLSDNGSDAKPALADVDADGDLDLFVGVQSGNTRYYQNTGTAAAPTFAAPVQNAFGLADVGDAASPWLVDLDADGDLDAMIGEQDGRNNYFRNDGTPSAPAFVAAGANPFGLESVSIGESTPSFADLDADGDLDGYMGNLGGNVRFYPNVGTASAPSFGTSTLSPFGIEKLAVASTPELADTDADGDLDLWLASSDGTALYLENVGTPNAPAFDDAGFINPFGLASEGFYLDPALADMDADGDLDVWVGESTGQVRYFENTGTPSTPAYTDRGVEAFGPGMVMETRDTAPAVADIDADGDLDLFLNCRTGVIGFFENTGTASAPAFAARVLTPFGMFTLAEEGSLAFADLDGDGDLDAFAGSDSPILYYLANTGTPTAPAFAPPVNNPFGLSFGGSDRSDPTFTDVDEDGDLDAVIGRGNGDLVFHENTGTTTAPTFAAPAFNVFGMQDVGRDTSPAFGDLDGDGDLDLLIGNIDSEFAYFENDPLPLCDADTDGDGVCDANDVCPEDPDPAQADGDFDGEGDACDPCTNLLPSYADRHKVVVSGLALPAGSQKLSAGGRCVPFLETPAIDPPRTGLRLVLRDATGTTLLDTIVPAGDYDPSLRAGWKMHSFPRGFTAQYKSTSHPAGIRTVKLVVKAGEGITKLAVVGREGDYSTVDGAALPLQFILALGTEPAANGQCCEMEFDATSGGTCVTKGSGSVLCR